MVPSLSSSTSLKNSRFRRYIFGVATRKSSLQLIITTYLWVMNKVFSWKWIIYILFLSQVRSRKGGIDLCTVNEQRRISQALLTEQRNQMSFFVTALLPVLVSILPKRTWSPLFITQIMFLSSFSMLFNVFKCDGLMDILWAF